MSLKTEEAPQPETPVEKKKNEETETPLEALASICVVLAIYLFVSTFVFQNFSIPSGSMEKTLLIGDHLLVDRLTFAPPTHWVPFMPYRDIRHGDIIVFYKPNPETPDLILVKRAIGLPGDHIHLRNGIVYLNGVAQNEPYAGKPGNDGNPQDAYYPYRDDFPAISPTPEDLVTATWQVDLPNHIQGDDLVVPPGMIFAMGDNRTESLDSRFWGFVPRQNILGRPLFIYWSFISPGEDTEPTLAQRLSGMKDVVLHFFTRTRWSRTLHVVR